MLKVRIIPTLLYKSVGLVKGIGFDSWRRVDTVLPAIKVYNMREVDELILLDIDATEMKVEPDYMAIADCSKECFVPLCVGGGIKSVEHIRQLLRVGADKVSINSESYENIGLITDGAKQFGTQCIVSSIDFRRIDGKCICFSHAGKKNESYEVSEWVKQVEEAGAGELLITSIEADGTMQGYDFELYKYISEIVDIPVIASGGAGSYEDMYRVIADANVSAVAAASVFHFTELTPRGAKEYLGERGVPIRR